MQGYPDPGRREVVSTNGGTEPVWSPDGREIFYRPLGGDGLIVVAITTDPSFSASRPKRLFDGSFVLDKPQVGLANYDIDPDGRRFVMVARTSENDNATGASALTVILNWDEELKRLAPTN